MFIHLKKDLQVKPLDWINCPDPQDSFDSSLPLTKYGINKDAQERLAAIRTDLDSFSDAEARALMISGYRMTEFELRRSLPELDQVGRGGHEDWRFMKFDESLTRADAPASIMIKLLSVAGVSRVQNLETVATAAALAQSPLESYLLVLFGWFCWENWNVPIVID